MRAIPFIARKYSEMKDYTYVNIRRMSQRRKDNYILISLKNIVFNI